MQHCLELSLPAAAVFSQFHDSVLNHSRNTVGLDDAESVFENQSHTPA